MNPKRVYAVLTVIIVVLAAVAAAGWTRPTAIGPVTVAPEYKIGALLSLTGETANLGTDQLASANIALNEINSMAGGRAKFTLVVQDDATSADGALKGIQTLVQGAGVQIVIGPPNSGELLAILSYINDNKIAIISTSSTAPALAIPGDYAYRVTATATLQAAALVKLMEDKGIKQAVVLERNDPWGVGVGEAMKQRMDLKGIKSTFVVYAGNLPDYASEVAQASSAVAAFGVSADTALACLCFETDGLNILGHMATDNVLSKTRVLATDGMSAAFPVETASYNDWLVGEGFLGTTASPAQSAIYANFEKEFVKQTGRQISSFGAYGYDATWIAALTILESGGIYKGEVFKDLIPQVAAHYYGVTGPKYMDANGDSLVMNLEIWTMTKTAGGYEVTHIGRYDVQTDSLTWT